MYIYVGFFFHFTDNQNCFFAIKNLNFFQNLVLQCINTECSTHLPFYVTSCRNYVQKLTFIFVFVLLSSENTKHERCLINRKSFSIQNTQRNVYAHLIWSVLYLLRETQYHLSQSRIMKFTISCF